MLLWHGSGWSTPRLRRLLSPEKSSGINFTGSAESTVSMGGRRDQKVSCFHGGSKPETLFLVINQLNAQIIVL